MCLPCYSRRVPLKSPIFFRLHNTHLFPSGVRVLHYAKPSFDDRLTDHSDGTMLPYPPDALPMYSPDPLRWTSVLRGISFSFRSIGLERNIFPLPSEVHLSLLRIPAIDRFRVLGLLFFFPNTIRRLTSPSASFSKSTVPPPKTLAKFSGFAPLPAIRPATALSGGKIYACRVLNSMPELPPKFVRM